MPDRIRLAAGSRRRPRRPRCWAAPARRTENVVLITTDGLRWQEVFGGADEPLLTKEAGVADPAALRAGVLARHAGGAARGAAAVPLDGPRAAGPALRQRAARQRGPRHQRPQLLLSRLQRAAQRARRSAHRQQRQEAQPQRDRARVAQPPRRPIAARWPPSAPGTRSPGSSTASAAACSSTPGSSRCRPPAEAERMAAAQPAPGRHHAGRGRRAARLADVRRRPRARAHGAAPRPLPRAAARPTTGRTPAATTTTCMRRGGSTGFTRRLWDEMQTMDQYRGQDHLRHHHRPRPRQRPHGMEEPRREDPRFREHLDRRARARTLLPLGERAQTETVTQSQVAATVAAALGEDFAQARHAARSGASGSDSAGAPPDRRGVERDRRAPWTARRLLELLGATPAVAAAARARADRARGPRRRRPREGHLRGRAGRARARVRLPPQERPGAIRPSSAITSTAASSRSARTARPASARHPTSTTRSSWPGAGT